MTQNWTAFCAFDKLPEHPYRRYTLVKPGYCIPFKSKDGIVGQFRIYVIRQDGKFLCKMSYKWGECDDWGRNIDKWDQYPDAQYIFYTFSPQNSFFQQYSTKEWINKKNAYIKSYKYVDFGGNEVAAQKFMKQVVDEVRKNN